MTQSVHPRKSRNSVTAWEPPDQASHQNWQLVASTWKYQNRYHCTTVQCTSNSTSTLSTCNAVTYQAQSAALSLVLIAVLLQASRQNYQSPVEGDALHDLTANGEQEMNIEAIKYGMLVI